MPEADGDDGFDWRPLAARAPGKEPEEVAQVGLLCSSLFGWLDFSRCLLTLNRVHVLRSPAVRSAAHSLNSLVLLLAVPTRPPSVAFQYGNLLMHELAAAVQAGGAGSRGAEEQQADHHHHQQQQPVSGSESEEKRLRAALLCGQSATAVLARVVRAATLLELEAQVAMRGHALLLGWHVSSTMYRVTLVASCDTPPLAGHAAPAAHLAAHAG